MYPVTVTTTGFFNFVCGIVAMEMTHLLHHLHDKGRARLGFVEEVYFIFICVAWCQVKQMIIQINNITPF